MAEGESSDHRPRRQCASAHVRALDWIASTSSLGRPGAYEGTAPPARVGAGSRVTMSHRAERVASGLRIEAGLSPRARCGLRGPIPGERRVVTFGKASLDPDPVRITFAGLSDRAAVEEAQAAQPGTEPGGPPRSEGCEFEIELSHRGGSLDGSTRKRKVPVCPLRPGTSGGRRTPLVRIFEVSAYGLHGRLSVGPKPCPRSVSSGPSRLNWSLRGPPSAQKGGKRSGGRACNRKQDDRVLPRGVRSEPASDSFPSPPLERGRAPFFAGFVNARCVRACRREPATA